MWGLHQKQFRIFEKITGPSPEEGAEWSMVSVNTSTRSPLAWANAIVHIAGFGVLVADAGLIDCAISLHKASREARGVARFPPSRVFIIAF